MKCDDWKKEYITKGQAVNAIVRNYDKIQIMSIVGGVEKYIKNLKAKEQSE